MDLQSIIASLMGNSGAAEQPDPMRAMLRQADRQPMPTASAPGGGPAGLGDLMGQADQSQGGAGFFSETGGSPSLMLRKLFGQMGIQPMSDMPESKLPNMPPITGAPAGMTMSDTDPTTAADMVRMREGLLQEYDRAPAATPSMPASPQSGVPGMSTGSMLFPATGMSNPFREGQSTQSASRGAPPIPAFSTEVQKAHPGGIEGLMASAQEFGKSPVGSALMAALRGGMMGAAGSGTGHNGAAFRNMASGFTTVDQAQQKRAQAEAAKKSAEAKLKFDQTLAVRKDNRAEGDSRRNDTKESRLAEEGKVKNQVAVEKLMKLRDDGTLSVDSRFKLQDQLNRYADKINKNGLMSPAELNKALRDEQDRLESYYGVKKPAAAAPTPGGLQDGMTATNPTTGAKMIVRGGQWQPL